MVDAQVVSTEARTQEMPRYTREAPGMYVS